MKKGLMGLAVFAVLAGSAPVVRANYDGEKTTGQQKEIRKDKADAASAAQRRDYWKEWVEFSQKQYAKTLKECGPDSDLTQDARERHDDAVKAFNEAEKDVASAARELRQDRKAN